MPVYLCRWPNGDFSIVSARNKADAIEQLDEWGNAEQAQLSRMESCMFDFRLNDEGEIELSQISEYTNDLIMQTCSALRSLCCSLSHVWESFRPSGRHVASLRGIPSVEHA